MAEPRRALVATAPTRLDFGGGWTDVPPFPEERGGFVCNIAINRRATVRLSSAPNAVASIDPLIRAAVRRSGVSGVDVQIASDFPIGAGLGGSSAAGVALAAALHASRGENRDAAALAEWSREIEVGELGIAGGRQDHYAAAFGGALALRFTHRTDVERLTIPANARTALERQCLLAYSGEARVSATTITAVLDAYRDRSPRVVSALDRMAQLARLMRDALVRGNIDELALLVSEHWERQRSLHVAISTPRIDAMHRAATNAGATGFKALGASGGGCVVVLAPQECVDHVSHAIAALAVLLPWKIEDDGVIVTPDVSSVAPTVEISR